MELAAAESRDKNYRKCGKQTFDRYRGKNKKANSFNILWANTEILQPAAYNSTPKPDVRRRFKDPDPIGKLVAETQKRCLEFATDTEDFDGHIKFDVLDMLVPGRGVSRVRYVPSFMQMSPEGQDPYEQIAWEQVCIEHVQWDGYRLGPGKTWHDVEWVAFYHRMKRDELKKLSPEYGETVQLDDCEDGAGSGIENYNEKEKEVFKTCGVWEIWDKPTKSVRYVTSGLKDHFLKTVPDPLKLTKFFPIPKPIYAVNDSGSMDPITLYSQYEEQAKELNRTSMRINKIADVLKVRGIYDATLSCLSELMTGDDNELIPAQDVARFMESGFDKAIWMLPIDASAKVLQALYVQRDAIKSVIYELTGISDILRGASNPNETLGAQEIKAQTGSQRIQQIQRDVARYIRDLMRMMGEIIAEKFQLETLQKMTGMDIPTKEQAMLQQQQQMMQAQQSGQPYQPQPMPITWEDVIEVLHDDSSRTFKIDIETDSTIAASIQTDMQGLSEVLGGVSQFVAGIMPMVQAGAFPVEAVKEIVMTIARRSKMGNAVEDALDQIQQPQQQGDPAQAQAQADAQKEAARAQADMQVQQFKSASEERMHAMELQHKAQLEQQKIESDQAMQQFQANLDAKMQMLMAAIDKDKAVEVAQVNASAKEDRMEIMN